MYKVVIACKKVYSLYFFLENTSRAHEVFSLIRDGLRCKHMIKRIMHCRGIKMGCIKPFKMGSTTLKYRKKNTWIERKFRYNIKTLFYCTEYSYFCSYFCLKHRIIMAPTLKSLDLCSECAVTICSHITPNVKTDKSRLYLTLWLISFVQLFVIGTMGFGLT